MHARPAKAARINNTVLVLTIMKTPKTRRSLVVIVALLTALGMAVVVPASPVVKPVYAQIVDVDEQIAEEFIPDFDLGLDEEMLPPLTFGQVVEEIPESDIVEEIEEEVTESDIELLPGL
jgi:hypothetical protein